MEDWWSSVETPDDVREGLRRFPEMSTFEICPECGIEQMVYAFGTTRCPDCGAEILPCSMCKECRMPCVYDTIRRAGGGKRIERR